MTENCRGLIIKGKWLDKIFAKKKVWEIRSSPTNIRGRIFLVQSGSGMVVGECNIVDCIKFDDNYDINNYIYVGEEIPEPTVDDIERSKE